MTREAERSLGAQPDGSTGATSVKIREARPPRGNLRRFCFALTLSTGWINVDGERWNMRCLKCKYQTTKQSQLDRHYANTGHHKEPRRHTYVQLGKQWKKVK